MEARGFQGEEGRKKWGKGGLELRPYIPKVSGSLEEPVAWGLSLPCRHVAERQPQ